MCAIDWAMVLEYLKVLMSWPPIVLVLGVLLILRFRDAVNDLIKRLVKANGFGAGIEAAPPQNSARVEVEENKIEKAAEAAEAAGGAGVAPGAAGGAIEGHPPTAIVQPTNAEEPAPPALPLELANDPMAPAAVAYIRANPAETLLEYKRVLMGYNFERILMRIYGTQVRVLEYLNAKGEAVPMSDLSGFHARHQDLSSRTEYQIRDYLGFLVSFGLVKIEGPEGAFEYSITQSGVEFLSYIKAQYPTDWNTRAF